MSTREGFLAAIRAEPDEALHRLVYADWLEEHGTADLDAVRAELIRVQTARETATGDAAWELRARERILLGRWGDALAAGVAEHVEDYRFRGGFVEAAALTVESLVRHGADMHAATPLRGVALGGPAEPLTPELLAPFDGLRIWSVPWQVESAEHQAKLAEAVRPRLLDVNAMWWDFLRAGLERGWPLRHLGLGTVRLPRPGGGLDAALTWGEEEVGPLFAGPLPAGLGSLDLRGVRLAPAGWNWLFGFPHWPQVERLALWVEPDLGDPFGYLSGRPGVAGLRSLWLGGAPGERFVPYGESLLGLRHLVVQGDDWFDPSRSHQPGDPSLSGLVSLRQEYFREGGDLVELLRPTEHWPALRVLELRRWQQNFAEVVPHLLSLPILPALKRLELPALPLDGLDARHGEHALAELTLSATDFSTSLAAVSRSAVLPHLVSLEIARARLDRPDDLEPLLDRSRFPHLRRIEVGGLSVDPAWERRFAERFGAGATFVAHPITHFAVHERILEGWL